MEITSIQYSFANIYYLQTYNQKRAVKEVYSTYKKGRLDDGSLGPPPDIWQIIPARKPNLFEEAQETIRVPHTESLRACKYNSINMDSSLSMINKLHTFCDRSWFL